MTNKLNKNLFAMVSLLSIIASSCDISSQPTLQPQNTGLVNTLAAQTWAVIEIQNARTATQLPDWSTGTFIPSTTISTQTPTLSLTPPVAPSFTSSITLSSTPEILIPGQTPTKTKWPTATPIPKGCNVARFVEDVTIPDDTKLHPSQKFAKIWRIYNSGICTWDSKYTFVFVTGDRMGGNETSLPHQVKPGEEVDITVNLVAPKRPGKYKGEWMLQVGSYTFGSGIKGDQSFWVKIIVAAQIRP
jgi:hypothetical protein